MQKMSIPTTAESRALHYSKRNHLLPAALFIVLKHEMLIVVNQNLVWTGRRSQLYYIQLVIEMCLLFMRSEIDSHVEFPSFVGEGDKKE